MLPNNQHLYEYVEKYKGFVGSNLKARSELMVCKDCNCTNQSHPDYFEFFSTLQTPEGAEYLCRGCTNKLAWIQLAILWVEWGYYPEKRIADTIEKAMDQLYEFSGLLHDGKFLPN